MMNSINEENEEFLILQRDGYQHLFKTSINSVPKRPFIQHMLLFLCIIPLTIAIITIIIFLLLFIKSVNWHYTDERGTSEKFFLSKKGLSILNPINSNNIKSNRIYNNDIFINNNNASIHNLKDKVIIRTIKSTNLNNTEIFTNSICDLPLAKGICSGKFIRYYFDSTLGKCVKFTYSGCGGNSNRFLSANDCNLHCLKKIKNSWNFIEHMNSSPCVDSFNINKTSPCENRLWTRRFYFNQEEQKCKEFWQDVSCDNRYNENIIIDKLENVSWKRKKESRNIFLRLNICQSICEIYLKNNLTQTNINGVLQARFENISVVMDNQIYPTILQLNKSPNHSLENNYFYKIQPNKIRYTANGSTVLKARVRNIPQNEYEAEIEAVNQLYKKIQRKRLFNLFKNPIAAECLEPFDTNLTHSCSKRKSEWIAQYYFDLRHRKCRLYWSNGCTNKKTRNNFEDLTTCLWMCESSYTINENQGSCVDLFDKSFLGDCHNNYFVLRYYFEHKQKQCKPFYYGGCKSKNRSKNIFRTYEECLNICENPSHLMQKSCLVPFNKAYRETCGNDLVKQYYYYDTTMRACRSFWYGNCWHQTTSIDNIFSSMESCQWLCEKNRYQAIPQACLEKFDNVYENSCTSSWVQKWYFEPATGRCQNFWYGGCKSDSQNIFISKEQCENLCKLSVLMSANIIKDANLIDENGDQLFQFHHYLACLDELKIGNCSHALPSYWYNKWTRECEPFVYSGCGGNKNRFLTLSQCHASCSIYKQLTEQSNCLQPLDQGSNNNILILNNMNNCTKNAGFRYYFSLEFACFLKNNDCLYILEPETEHEIRELLIYDNDTQESENNNFIIEKQNMRFNNDTRIWSYNSDSGRCEQKWQLNSSCPTSVSMFRSEKECINTCTKLVIPKLEECMHVPDWGPCNQLRYAWFYNISSGSCATFLYGGCGGNSNRFSTKDDCESKCVAMIEDNPCHDELDRGKWCERMSTRYYYNKRSNICRGFHYTGCGQSRNNFLRLNECQNKCVIKTKTKLVNKVAQNKNEDNDELSDEYNSTLSNLIQRHEILNEAKRNYMKSADFSLNENECVFFRYNVSGSHTRLTSYFCVVEKDGTCQINIFSNTHSNEYCQKMRTWKRGRQYNYSLFFTIERRQSENEQTSLHRNFSHVNLFKSYGLERFHKKNYFDIIPNDFTDEKKSKFNARFKQSAEKTEAKIMILPNHDCRNVC